jgi:hypothetical protein
MNVRLRTWNRCLVWLGSGWAIACALGTGAPAWGQLVQPVPAQAPARQVATAEQSVVEGYSVPAGDVNQLAARLSQQFAGRNDVRIAADVRQQKIVAIAPAAVQREIAAAIVQSLSAPAAAPDGAIGAPVADERRSLHRIELKNLSW